MNEFGINWLTILIKWNEKTITIWLRQKKEEKMMKWNGISHRIKYIDATEMENGCLRREFFRI